MVIDTGVIIDHLRAKDKTSTKLFEISDNAPLYISAVSLYELHMGATTPQKLDDVVNITEGLIVLPFNDQIAVKASQIYHSLRRSNQIIEFRDIFIAATCIINGLPIVTLNRKHFHRVDDLRII